VSYSVTVTSYYPAVTEHRHIHKTDMNLQQTLSPKNAFSFLILLDFDGVILQNNAENKPASLWYSTSFSGIQLQYTQCSFHNLSGLSTYTRNTHHWVTNNLSNKQCVIQK